MEAQPIVVRRAAAGDAAALTRRRELMLSDMGLLAAGASPSPATPRSNCGWPVPAGQATAALPQRFEPAEGV